MFKRGFKAWCERIAVEKRSELGLSSIDPLPPSELADLIGVKVWKPADIPNVPSDCLRKLLHDDPDSWSAVTLRLPNVDLIIVNSAHSAPRQASDLMHELAHILLGHNPTRVDVTEQGHLLLRTHDHQQEEEANWLAGSLLLPRPSLVNILRNGGISIEVARSFGVSMDMLTYRYRITGVEVQGKRSRWR